MSESSRIRLGGSQGPGPPGSGLGVPRVQVSESSRVRLGVAQGPGIRVIQGQVEGWPRVQVSESSRVRLGGAWGLGVRVLQDQIGGCLGSRCPSLPGSGWRVLGSRCPSPSSWDRHSLSTSCVKSSQSVQSRALSRGEPLGCLSLCKSPYSAVFSAVWKAMRRHLK